MLRIQHVQRPACFRILVSQKMKAPAQNHPAPCRLGKEQASRHGLSIHFYSMKAQLFLNDPEGNDYTEGEAILDPERDAALTGDLTDDETAYNERGDIRHGVLGEDDPTDDGLLTDIRTGEDENVTPGS